MFLEFENQEFAPSTPSVSITNNTDTSIDGSSRMITWEDAQYENVTISFDAIDLSDYEEISMYIYCGDTLAATNLFYITINGVDYSFRRSDIRRGRWQHILFDCSSMGEISSIKITSLVENLVMLVDYIGYRRVGDDCDVDIVKALQSHINLDYDVETVLKEAIEAGAERVALISKNYVTDNSVIEIDDGAGTIEEVTLISEDGETAAPIQNDFPVGSVVRIICPVLKEDYDSVEPDPVCGIKVYDMQAEKDPTIEKMTGKVKLKEYLGTIGIIIYIDCAFKKKLLQLAREYNRKYGSEFQFLLDGELVDIYQSSQPIFSDDVIGNNPRIAYYYNI
jgi:hypothetical protein